MRARNSNRRRKEKGLNRSSWCGGEGRKEGRNHWCHVAQESDLARMAIVQVDSESLPGRRPLPSVAPDARPTTDFPAK